MIKRILTVVIFVAAVALAGFFTWLNPGEIRLDLGWTAREVPLGLAFVLVLAVGWLLGILSALLWVARISADRRRLRSKLKNAAATGLSVRDERG